jgi:hypothetical protein
MQPPNAGIDYVYQAHPSHAHRRFDRLPALLLGQFAGSAGVCARWSFGAALFLLPASCPAADDEHRSPNAR